MVRKIYTFLLCLITLLISSISVANALTKSTKHITINLFSNGLNEIVARFDIKPDWHIYWSNPGEIGTPTTVSARNSNLTILNQSIPTVRNIYDEMNEYLYENTAFFQLKLDNLKQAEITFDFVECSDVCKPEQVTFDLKDIKTSDIAEWLQIKEKANATFPLKITIPSALNHNKLELNFTDKDEIDFIPTKRDIIDENSINISRDKNTLKIQWTSQSAKPLEQALILTPNKNYLAEITYQNFDLSNLIYIILLAFIGGIILNAMPCVFPILSLKIFNLISQPKPKRRRIYNALSYIIGVVCSFLLLTAFLVILKAKGEAVGWGFQLQSPYFVCIMSIIFFLLFLYMVEWIKFPDLSGSIVHRIAGLNSFTTGFFAVLIASPCTGPFMGAAVGYAFMRNNYETFAVFTALALGYALPYALIELYPHIIKRFAPRPGKWMYRLKVILSIPVLLTAIWLCSIWLKQLSLPIIDNSQYNLNWQPYDATEISKLNAKKENIFIDFTADWCLTCKFNEKITLDTDRFRNFVKANNVHLFVADLTDNDEKYYDALQSYGRDSIPLYIYYTNGYYKILPLFFSIKNLNKKDN